MEQGHVQHRQVAFGVLDLALDVIEAFDVGPHELGIERAARSTACDAQRESEPVHVLERHHRRHRIDLLTGLLRRGDGLGQRVQPAGIVVGEDVPNSGDFARRGTPLRPDPRLPISRPGVDLVVGDVPQGTPGNWVQRVRAECDAAGSEFSRDDCEELKRAADPVVSSYPEPVAAGE